MATYSPTAVQRCVDPYHRVSLTDGASLNQTHHSWHHRPMASQCMAPPSLSRATWSVRLRQKGRRHPPPPAAEQRASHPNSLPRDWRNTTWPRLPHPGGAVHLAAPRPAHASDVHLQLKLPRGHRQAANPRTPPHTQPQQPPPGTGVPPPLSYPRGSALAAGHASLQQPHGPQPHRAGRLLRPGQPGLAARGLCQRVG